MSFSEIINERVRARLPQIAENYARAEPFSYVVIDDFLTPAFAKSLLEQFPAFERGNNLGDDGKAGKKSTFERIKSLGNEYLFLDKAIQQRDFLDMIGAMTGIPDLLYDPFYLGGGTHENRDGQSLHAHVDFNDYPSEGWHRRLNLIVYLNPEWDSAWGGNLEFFRDPYKDAAPAQRIAPLFNRCVIFGTTEKSWHGFDRIQLPEYRKAISRKSIALYFYSKDRPQDEVAGKHTTHYVNQQLPERIVAGYTLTQDDVNALKELTSDRDALLQRLYADNASLRQAQDRGVSGKILYLLRRTYVRFRR